MLRMHLRCLPGARNPSSDRVSERDQHHDDHDDLHHGESPRRALTCDGALARHPVNGAWGPRMQQSRSRVGRVRMHVHRHMHRCPCGTQIAAHPVHGAVVR